MTTENCIVKQRSNKIDVELGFRIRFLRKKTGLSLMSLAHDIGVSYQQLQKYESGYNRISVSALLAVAKALAVDPSSLLDGLGKDPTDLIDDALVVRDTSFPARRMEELFLDLTDTSDRELLLYLAARLAAKGRRRAITRLGHT
jgi:transcriptional regulator with XRE-family HTH domain